MRRLLIGILAFALSLWIESAPAWASNMPVTLESLLTEMIDREALARWPSPAYTAREFTSYDRASVSPDKPGWFANTDFGNYLRTEDNHGRKEYVMMDVDGPGAIVCIFKATTDPTAIVRVYLDNSTLPVVEENFRYFLGGGTETEQERRFPEKRVPPSMADESRFLGGFGTIKPPLASVDSLGCNLYLPIPYAKHCKVTYDKPGKCFYRFNYRTYAPSTSVETFTLPALKKASAVIDAVGKALMNPSPVQNGAIKRLPSQTQTLAPGASLFPPSIVGPGALKLLSIRLSARDQPQALRSTVLGITFDGLQTVWCPVGDFFGSGIGVHRLQDWDFAVDSDGAMRSFWVMPFSKSCKIELLNLGSQPVDATLGDLVVAAWQWDQRSMYFHANWRQQYPIQTKARDGTMDWNYIEAEGRGIYVGDSLVVHNNNHTWWGEGDEKVYVDGESFPSHFGTGTEDYYGYSRGGKDSMPFQEPFVAHMQVEGDKSPGYSSPTRIRSLDGIPFAKHLKFDMEIWHWQVTTMAYAVATYWYALPGATSNRGRENVEAARPLLPDNALLTGHDK